MQKSASGKQLPRKTASVSINPAKEKVEEEYNAIQKRVLATLTRYDTTMRDAESGADVLTQATTRWQQLDEFAVMKQNAFSSIDTWLDDLRNSVEAAPPENDIAPNDTVAFQSSQLIMAIRGTEEKLQGLRKNCIDYLGVQPAPKVEIPVMPPPTADNWWQTSELVKAEFGERIRNWELDEECVEARIAEMQMTANATTAKWKYECQRRTTMLEAERKSRADAENDFRRKMDDLEKKLADATKALNEKPKGNAELEKKLTAEIERQKEVIAKLETQLAEAGKAAAVVAPPKEGPPSLGMKKLKPEMNPHELIKGLQDMSTPLLNMCKGKKLEDEMTLSFVDFKMIYDNILECGKAAVAWKNNPNALNGNAADNAKEDSNQPSRVRKLRVVLPALDIDSLQKRIDRWKSTQSANTSKDQLWKETMRIRLDYCQHALSNLVEADPDEIDRVVASIPPEQRNEIVYTNDYIANMSVYQGVMRWINLAMRRNLNKPPLIVQDLSLQFRDGIALLRLLDVVYERSVDWVLVEKRPTAANIDYLLSLLDERKLNGGRMVTKEDIRDGHADIMFAVCCRLMVADGGFRFEPKAVASLLGNFRQLTSEIGKIGVSKDEYPLDKLVDLCTAVAKLEQYLAMMRTATDTLNYSFLATAMHALSARRNGLLPSVEELGGDNDAKHFGKLDVKRLYDLFKMPAGFDEPPFHEVTELNELMDTHRLALKRVFRYYSAGTGVGAVVSMSMSEFRRFLRDIRVLDSYVSREWLDLLVIRVNYLTPDEEKKLAETGVQPRERELIASKFVEAVIRVAAMRFDKVADMTLPAKFAQFIESHMLKFACQTSNVTFRRDVLSSDVHKVFQAYHQILERVYRHYQTASSRGFSTPCWSLDSWQSFCSDASRVLLGSVSQQRLRSLFGDAQGDGSDAQAAQIDATAASLEMSFDEFLETLAALATFVQPDPYLALSHRLGNFLTNDLLPALQDKVRTLRRYAVVGVKDATHALESSSPPPATRKLGESADAALPLNVSKP